MLDKANNLQDIISDEFAKQYGVSPVNPNQNLSPEEDPSGLKSLDNAANNCKPYNPITDLTPELEINSSNISDFALKQLENCFYAETTGKNNSALSKILSSNDGVPFNKAVRRKSQRDNFPEPGQLNLDYKEQIGTTATFDQNHSFQIGYTFESNSESPNYFYNRVRNWKDKKEFYFHQILDKKSSNLILDSIQILNDYNGNSADNFVKSNNDLSYSEELFYYLLKRKANLNITKGYSDSANSLFSKIKYLMVTDNEENYMVIKRKRSRNDI